MTASAGATRLRARMFSPLSGTIEDAATGSAATPLAALLLSLTQGDRSGATTSCRASRWAGRAACSAPPVAPPTASAPSVGGGCVPVLKGEIIAIARRRRTPRAGSGRRRRPPCSSLRMIETRSGQADQRARHRHLAGVVGRDADLLAGLEAARDRLSSTLPGSGVAALATSSASARSSRSACRCRTLSCARTIRRSWAAGRAATACCPRPCGTCRNHTGL